MKTTSLEVFPIQLTALKLHAEATYTPVMTDEAFTALKDSLGAIGQLEPILIYRNQIVDGRHRWLAMQELGNLTINCIKMPHKSSLVQIRDIVIGKEVRRHETASQLAIRAYRLMKEDGDINQESAARVIGSTRRRVGEAKRIAEDYGRPDVLEHIMDNVKFEVGVPGKPRSTDNLTAILTWLKDNAPKSKTPSTLGYMQDSDELTEVETALVNNLMDVVKKQHDRVRKQLIRDMYQFADTVD